jgi:hypothetical protein
MVVLQDLLVPAAILTQLEKHRRFLSKSFWRARS